VGWSQRSSVLQAGVLDRAYKRVCKKPCPHARGARKNCLAFFPIIWPNQTESAGFLALEPVKLQASYYSQPLFANTFLQSFCAVETGYYDQFEMDALLRQCRFASPLMPLTRPGLG
jgi:hypothetical protein